MIRVILHRKFADGSPSLSVSPRRGFRTFESAASSAVRLLADETRQPGHEQVAEYGAWFCPPHALLNIAKTLLTLYRAQGDADWSQICELIAETLPGVVAKAEAADGRSAPP